MESFLIKVLPYIIISIWSLGCWMFGVLCESFIRDIFGKSLSNKYYGKDKNE